MKSSKQKLNKQCIFGRLLPPASAQQPSESTDLQRSSPHANKNNRLRLKIIEPARTRLGQRRELLLTHLIQLFQQLGELYHEFYSEGCILENFGMIIVALFF